MKSNCVAMLLSDLGVTKTHSRPHLSNDNAFSESQFKTLKLKYRHSFQTDLARCRTLAFFVRIFLTGTTRNIIIQGLL